MSHPPYSIELHDSDVSAIEKVGSDVRLLFSPAYIHKDGKGWAQDLEVVIHQADLDVLDLDLPATLADGSMKSHIGYFRNLIGIPFSMDGEIELELEFMSGDKVSIHGDGVSHEFKSSPVFIEEFPDT